MSNSKSKILAFCAWFFGVGIILGAFGLLSESSFIGAGLIMLVSGVLFLPPVQRFILGKKSSLSRGKTTAVASILMFISIFYMSSIEDTIRLNEIAEYEMNERFEKDEEFKATAEFEKLAAKGDAYDQYSLGLAYKEKSDNEKTFEWFQKSADQGNAKAQAELIDMYYDGVGVPQDKEKAFEWAQKSANQGSREAQLLLGSLYSEGMGINQSDEKAFEWNLKAANQGSAEAQFNVGRMYGTAVGVSKNYDESTKWFGKSCDNGLESGCEAYEVMSQ